MKINEVANPAAGSDNRLLGLVQFLAGRAKDTGGQQKISQDAFIKLAQGLNINVNRATLPNIVSQEPLSSVLMLDTNTGDLIFKTADIGPTAMPVDKAQEIVAKSAKAAMKRGLT